MSPTSSIHFSELCTQCQRPVQESGHVLFMSTEWVEYPAPDCWPQVAVVRSERIARCCSHACLQALLARRLAGFSVKLPSSAPDIGPVEVCAKCNGVVDMSAEHLCIWHAQEPPAVHKAAALERLRYAAVFCRNCSAVVACMHRGAPLARP